MLSLDKEMKNEMGLLNRLSKVSLEAEIEILFYERITILFGERISKEEVLSFEGGHGVVAINRTFDEQEATGVLVRILRSKYFSNRRMRPH